MEPVAAAAAGHAWFHAGGSTALLGVIAARQTVKSLTALLIGFWDEVKALPGSVEAAIRAVFPSLLTEEDRRPSCF